MQSIMRNAGQDETQARIKIARININNLRYADNTTWEAQKRRDKGLKFLVKLTVSAKMYNKDNMLNN